jgi:hypothetical protein
MSNRWANFNGPGKPITKEQLAEILADVGVEEQFDENGEGYYRREDIERAFKHYYGQKN